MLRRHRINKKKELELKKDKETIREKALKEINSLSKRIKEKELDAQASEFYDILRKFFAKIFKIKYQFTYEELRDELEKKKLDNRFQTRIDKFINKLTHIEYSNVTLTNERLKELITELKYLVKQLTIIEKPEKKKVAKKLDSLKSRITKKANIFKKLKLKKVSKPNKIIKDINLLLKEGNESLKNRDTKKAGIIYKKIYELYRQLSLKDKDKIYNKISKVYKKKEPIYDLLNNAYSALLYHKTDESRHIYMQITNLYNNLSEDEKERVHDEILRVFRPKHKEDIEQLLKKAYYYLAKKDIENLKDVYENIDTTYRDSSEKEKEEYYSQIIQLYDDMKVIFS